MAIRILIVDDEQSIVDSLRDIIGSDGYDVMCAYSAEEALAKAAELCPDILLSDVLMPKMHGFELALQLKQICPNCHLLFFSGQAATAQLAQSFVHTFTRLGYRFELLPKPIHPETLLQKLQDSLTRAA